jgi:tetratricopeptide (TPR) repeat protein
LFVVAGVTAVGFFGWRRLHGPPSYAAEGSSRPTSEIKSRALEYRRKGDLDGFIRELDSVPDNSPEKQRSLFEQAVAYRQIGDGVGFERSIAKCLEHATNELSPSESTLHAWGLLVDHYLIQERWEECYDVLWKLFDAAPDAERKQYILLRLLAGDGERYDTSEAIEWHRRFVARSDDDCNSRRALGLNLARAGRTDDARGHLEYCAKRNPEISRFQESWLWFLFLVEDVDEASRVLETLHPTCGSSASIWVYRGRVYEVRGDWDSAVNCYRKAVELDPYRLDAHNRLAQSLRARQQRSEAMEEARIAKELTEAKGTILDLRERLLRDSITPDGQLRSKLAELCHTLGLDREALAWSSFE